MKILLALLIVVSQLFSFVIAQEVELVREYEIRYEAGMFKKAIRPESLFCIPFGTGEGEVGGRVQDTLVMSEGVPFSFLPQKDGSVVLLDSINHAVKHFGPVGNHLKTVDLTELVKTEDLPMVMRDLALAPGGDYYIVFPRDETVKRVNDKGKVVVEVEGLGYVSQIASDKAGNLLIDTSLPGGVLKFNPAGEIINHYNVDGLSVYTDIEGRPYGLSFNNQEAHLFRVDVASPSKKVMLAKFAHGCPPENQVRYIGGKVIGVDALMNVYVEMVACDEDGSIHQHRIIRFDPSGKELAMAEIIAPQYFSPDLPRHMTVMPDGRILTFDADNETYSLLAFSLPEKSE